VFAFDLLHLRDKDLRSLPLLKRKAALDKELTGEKLFLAADGRSPNWVKIKTAHGRHIDEERAKWNE
jgi:ATP-dependent DNA ligase